MNKQIMIVWKNTDIKGRKVLHLVYEENGIYYHEMRRWIRADLTFVNIDTILRQYKGYNYISNIQYNLHDTWLVIAHAIRTLDKHKEE